MTTTDDPIAVDDDELDGLEASTEERAFLDLLRRRRLMTPVTKALVAALVLVSVFLGGAFVQRHFGADSSTAGAFPGLPEGFPAGLGGGGAAGGDGAGAIPDFGQFGGAADGVTGTIQLIDGNYVYIAGADGSITKVEISDETAITLTREASAADLTPALTVTVQGTADENGTVAATSITEQATSTGG